LDVGKPIEFLKPNLGSWPIKYSHPIWQKDWKWIGHNYN